jgi:SAM-dependent methyltransferase
MPESFSSKLQIWEGWLPTVLRGTPPAALTDSVLAGFLSPAESADRLFDEEARHATLRDGERPEPFSLQWYLAIEQGRHSRHGAWGPRLLEFAKHSGESVLGLGDGLGTDWVQYARHGARVTVCSRSLEQLALVQRNFDLRGLRGSFFHTDLQALPVESASIDVVCLTGVVGEVEAPGPLVEEIYRVLKPGGKVLAVVRARYDIHFWRQFFMPWQRWLPAGRAREAPANGLSGRGLRRLFDRFIEPRTYKRHLRRREVPHLWRWLPHPLLQRLFGKFLIFKAFKPISPPRAIPAAA